MGCTWVTAWWWRLRTRVGTVDACTARNGGLNNRSIAGAYELFERGLEATGAGTAVVGEHTVVIAARKPFTTNLV